MAASQSAVKEQVTKNLDKIKGKIRTLKNIINKPRNDYPEVSNGEFFVIADGDIVVFKLEKQDGKISISGDIRENKPPVTIVNLFTGQDIFDEIEDHDSVRLYQISKDGKELCRVTVGGGLIANIKKTDETITLDTWLEV